MTDSVASSALAAPRLDPNELRIARLRALRGPNFWRLAPVIACDVMLGELEPLSTSDAPEFADRLLDALPSLHERRHSPDASDGFADSLRDGASWPHVLE